MSLSGVQSLFFCSVGCKLDPRLREDDGKFSSQPYESCWICPHWAKLAGMRFPELSLRICTLCISLILALVIAGCAQEAEEDLSDGSATVYRHAMDGAPTSLDPALASNVYANFLVVNFYDTLYRYKYLARPYSLEPNLAEGLPQISTDGLIYTIRIRPGVHFKDDAAFPDGRGRAVTAQDFVYSIKATFRP